MNRMRRVNDGSRLLGLLVARIERPRCVSRSWAEILLRLPDPLADKTGQVDAVQVHVQVVGHHFGGQGLAGAPIAREQRDQSVVRFATPRSPRFAAGLGDVACVRREVSE